MEFRQEFIQRMTRLTGDFHWMDGYKSPPRRGLRVNTLKCSGGMLRALWAHTYGEPLVPTPFAPDTFYVPDEHRAGADPLHHAGAYYMQEPSATTAVLALAPRPGERILDLCAAPGGKSTQIAAAMQGEGLLWCNEYVKPRAQALLQNLERCGVENAVVSSTDSRTLAEGLSRYFDGVLVDAPCSGEGMFRKEPAALAQWTVDLVKQCAARGKEILAAAAEMVRPGGRLVYSTCTFAPEENECQIAAFLAAHPDFALENCEMSCGSPGLSAKQVAPFAESGPLPDSLPLALCRRLWPGQGGEGHFVARLRRKDGAADSAADTPGSYRYPKPDTAFVDWYRELTGRETDMCPERFGETIRLLPKGLPALRGLGVLAAGVAAASVCKDRLEPAHALVMARGTQFRQTLSLLLTDVRVAAYLRGEAIPADTSGWTAVLVEGIPLGLGKANGGRLNNRYPKGLRRLAEGVSPHT